MEYKLKVRNGFVSNSSSSFCLYGVTMSYNDFIDRIEKVHRDAEEPLESYCKTWGLQYAVESDFMQVWLGLGPDDILDNETGGQFKTRVCDKLDLSGVRKPNEPAEWYIQEISC